MGKKKLVTFAQKFASLGGKSHSKEHMRELAKKSVESRAKNKDKEKLSPTKSQ